MTIKKFNIQLVNRALGDIGYSVQKAFNGLAGLKFAQKLKLFGILLKINMSDMRFTPIIAITKNSRKGDIGKAFAAGGYVHMAKPIYVCGFLDKVGAFATDSE